MQTLKERTAPVWRWEFTSPTALRKALEEYTAYDMSEGLPTGTVGDSDTMDRAGRIYAQNAEIDRGMIYVGAFSRFAWTLLDGYYRRGNWSNFRKGWITVLRAIADPNLPAPQCPGPVRCRLPGDDRCDLPACVAGRRCLEVHDAFEECLTICIEALCAVIEHR